MEQEHKFTGGGSQEFHPVRWLAESLLTQGLTRLFRGHKSDQKVNFNDLPKSEQEFLMANQDWSSEWDLDNP